MSGKENYPESQRNKFSWQKGDVEPAVLSQCAKCENNSSATGCSAFRDKPIEFWDNVVVCPMRKEKV